MKISKSEQIAHVFDAFHDGTIISIANQENIIVLTIDIEYLAERFGSDFTKFFLELETVRDFQLVVSDKHYEQPEIITDMLEIEKLEPEILSSELIKDTVIINCMVYPPKANDNFGKLQFKANSLLIKTEDRRVISQEDIERSWDELSAHDQ